MKRRSMKAAKDYLVKTVDKKKTPISARLRDSLFHEAKRFADKEKITFNSLIEASLTRFLDEMNQKKSA